MKKLATRLDFWFLLTGVVLLIPSLLCAVLGIPDLDITAHDTYFVVDFMSIGLWIFGIHIFFAIVYFLLRKNYYYQLGFVHFALGLPLFIYLVYNLVISNRLMGMSGVPRRYYIFSGPGIFENNDLLGPLLGLIILFMAAQLVFLVNCTISVLKSVKSSR